jgi:hypothetical protein
MQCRLARPETTVGIASNQLFLGLLAAFGVIVVAAFGVLLVYERRRFARMGKLAAWRRVRLAGIPIAAVTAAAVALPTRAVGGMEALAVLYGLLFTLAPALWLGGHWLAGRAGRPPLTARESLCLALTVPAFGIGAVLVAHWLQPIAWAIVRAAQAPP